MAGARRLLFLSNGHGEDSLAAKIIDRLRPADGFEISAWAMVGDGAAYRRRNVPLVGVSNLLPGCGLSTLTWKYFWGDLRAGWISTHWRQYRAAQRLCGRFDFAVAVGDIIPIAAACLARLPFLLVGCAKSSYYDSMHGYTALEKRLLRKHCRLVFPRDLLTTRDLLRAGIPVRYVGNPMMDDLAPTGQDFGLPTDLLALAFLPGSRPDTLDNLSDLLSMAPVVVAACARPAAILVAAYDGLEVGAVAAQPPGGWRLEPQRSDDPHRGITLRLSHETGVDALVLQGRFADAVLRADVVVGVAGTANEQAVGLGRPLVVFPTRGLLGETYVKMKGRYFGPAALSVPRDAHAVASAVRRILHDPELRATMAAAGRERMGDPGASQAIADEVRAALAQLDGRP